MSTTYYATFDGEVFRPEELISLEPNTRVRVIVDAESGTGPERIPDESGTYDDDPYMFLRILREANFDGPPDWSERFHYYLYGDDSRSDE